jgi:hypothetical protein
MNLLHVNTAYIAAALAMRMQMRTIRIAIRGGGGPVARRLNCPCRSALQKVTFELPALQKVTFEP